MSLEYELFEEEYERDASGSVRITGKFVKKRVELDPDALNVIGRIGKRQAYLIKILNGKVKSVVPLGVVAPALSAFDPENYEYGGAVFFYSGGSWICTQAPGSLLSVEMIKGDPYDLKDGAKLVIGGWTYTFRKRTEI